MSSKATQSLDGLEDEGRRWPDEAIAACDRMLDAFEATAPPGACLRAFVDDLTLEVLSGRLRCFVTFPDDPAPGTTKTGPIIFHADRFWLAVADAANKRMVQDGSPCLASR